jgi:hypothetical protein
VTLLNTPEPDGVDDGGEACCEWCDNASCDSVAGVVSGAGRGFTFGSSDFEK